MPGDRLEWFERMAVSLSRPMGWVGAGSSTEERTAKPLNAWLCFGTTSHCSFFICKKMLQPLAFRLSDSFENDVQFCL